MLERNTVKRKHFRVRLCPKNLQVPGVPEMLKRNNVKRKHFGVKLHPLTRVFLFIEVIGKFKSPRQGKISTEGFIFMYFICL